MKLENTQVQMRKGILEFCILEIIARGEAYASDMLEELRDTWEEMAASVGIIRHSRPPGDSR